MMTKEALEKLNTKQRNAVDGYKTLHSKKPDADVRIAAISYLAGLVDAGVLTETEKKALFCYITL